jgi:hypothetical protein
LTTEFKQLTPHDLIVMMGERLNNRDATGRYPDLEQDAIRYWVARDLLVNFVQGDYERLDKLLDDKIKRIFGK